jgi:hypothetical protein
VIVVVVCVVIIRYSYSCLLMTRVLWNDCGLIAPADAVRQVRQGQHQFGRMRLWWANDASGGNGLQLLAL